MNPFCRNLLLKTLIPAYPRNYFDSDNDDNKRKKKKEKKGGGKREGKNIGEHLRPISDPKENMLCRMRFEPSPLITCPVPSLNSNG